MSNSIVPTARALTVCDYLVSFPDGKVDLYGTFSRFQVPQFPHTLRQMAVFAQLTGGLGDVPVFIDIRHVARDELVHTTNRFIIHFPDRLTLRQLALTLRGCRFPHPGLYTVELYCHNQWVCDTMVHIS